MLKNKKKIHRFGKHEIIKELEQRSLHWISIEELTQPCENIRNRYVCIML